MAETAETTVLAEVAELSVTAETAETEELAETAGQRQQRAEWQRQLSRQRRQDAISLEFDGRLIYGRHDSGSRWLPYLWALMAAIPLGADGRHASGREGPPQIQKPMAAIPPDAVGRQISGRRCSG